jgi:hypothetical protein
MVGSIFSQGDHWPQAWKSSISATIFSGGAAMVALRSMRKVLGRVPIRTPAG